MHPGCGIQLAFKIIKDSGILVAPKPETKNAKAKPRTLQLFVSSAAAQHFIESAAITQLADPAAAPPGSIVLADELSAREHLPVLHQAKDLIYICVNTSGRQLAKRLGVGAFAATASVAFYDDLIAKLQKAVKPNGLRFIEILTPCPKLWCSEPSNTVEIARQAVETGLWPLFELDHGRFALSYKPAKIAGTESFIGLQKLIVPDRGALEKSWRLMTLGKPFETE